VALTNAQYESIRRGYEDRQNQNRYEMNRRLEQVYANVAGYRELDERVSSVSLQQAQKLLDGDTAALQDLKIALAKLSAQKRASLQAAGFPTDYLDPIYSCPDCHDTGYMQGKKCHCFIRQITELMYEQSNIRQMLARENFSTLSYKYYEGEDLLRFQNAVKNCKIFIENFKTDYANLLFYGKVGTGKSFLSGCIAKELLEKGHSVIYFSSVGLFDALARRCFDTNAREELHDTYEDLYNCDLMIIDDLGTEITNSFVMSQLFSCLNERHLRRKATIISTNLSLEELRDRYSDRIFSRITSNYQLYKLSGPDIRMYKKRIENRK